MARVPDPGEKVESVLNIQIQNPSRIMLDPGFFFIGLDLDLIFLKNWLRILIYWRSDSYSIFYEDRIRILVSSTRISLAVSFCLSVPLSQSLSLSLSLSPLADV